MDAILCACSSKRVAMLEEEPEVLQDLLEARHDGEIPGLLDLGKTWHALDILLGDGKDEVLADALVARNGKKMKAAAAHGNARLIAAARVAEIAKALEALPANLVADRYGSLYGKTVHGGYGQDMVAPGDKEWLRDKITKNHAKEIAELTEALAAVVALYREAATAKQSMMSIIV
ncbi:MAG: DUF1877 family protein [Deltaproteobacteria bacterium]|nr:DUF1877 family protein [Deltaproteobacteria bacterium]